MSKDGEELSDEVKNRLQELDNMPFNRHSVNLERVQRIHLDIDDEQMTFDEQSIAHMLQELADEERYGHVAFVLAAVANALRGDDDHHKLILRQTKRGKWESPSENTTKIRQHLAWVIRLERLKAQGWQTDAAVHRIAETTGKSVAKIYAGISENKEMQEIYRSLRQTFDQGSKKQS